MKKKFYDIIPADKRSIRNVTLSSIHHNGLQRSHLENEFTSSKKSPIHFEKESTSLDESQKKTSSYSEKDTAPDSDSKIKKPKKESPETFDSWNASSKKTWRIWFAAVIAICILSYGFSVYFSKAVITIKPSTHEVSVASLRLSLKDVDHDVVDFTLTATSTIAAKGTTHIETRATGTIVIYNTYSSASQKLISGTRMVAPNSLVYKLVDTVIVPGQKTTDGKVTAGSVEAKIVAEKAGGPYNTLFTDFAFQGFEGTDKYKKIYGRSKTALTGGFVGDKPNITAADLVKAVSALHQTLASSTEDELRNKLSEMSDGFIYIPDSTLIEYAEPTQVPSSDGSSVMLLQKSHVVAVLLQRKAVGQLIAGTIESIKSDNLGSRVGFELATSSSSTLKATFETNVDADAIKRGSVSLYIDGTSTIASFIDQGVISKAVKGFSRTQAIQTIHDIVETDDIVVVIQPRWNSKLPIDAENIKVISR